MKRVCIIPARSGSQRIPDKNIRDFAGRPIIHHAIDCARASGLFARVIVSTDSERIAAVARDAGAEVPFLRSAANADAHAPVAAAVIECIHALGVEGEEFDPVCCLLATAPLVRAEMLASACEQLESGPHDSVVSVQRFRYPILRALRIDAEGHLEMLWPEHRTSRSQDLGEAWHDAGQFYWIRRESLLRHGRLIAGRAAAYPLGALDAVDIDDAEDWDLAEQLYRFHHALPVD